MSKHLELLAGLADLFDWAGLDILDVGARGGALRWMAPLAPFSNYYACEPDPIATTKLIKENALGWRKMVVVPEALGETSGPLTLNRTRHPGFSSIYKPNMKVAKRFGLGRDMSVESTFETEAITLQAAAAKYGFDQLGLLKIDTQGSELGILKSGQQLITEHVQAIFIELEFFEFYHKQPLFSRVSLFLGKLGFEIMNLSPVHLRRVVKDGVSYSRPELVWAHALYIKKGLDISWLRPEESLRRISRQLAIAVAFEHFDYVASALLNEDIMRLFALRGAAVTIADLEAYIRATVSETLYREFALKVPAVIKDRIRFFTS